MKILPFAGLALALSACTVDATDTAPELGDEQPEAAQAELLPETPYGPYRLTTNDWAWFRWTCELWPDSGVALKYVRVPKSPHIPLTNYSHLSVLKLSTEALDGSGWIAGVDDVYESVDKTAWPNGSVIVPASGNWNYIVCSTWHTIFGSRAYRKMFNYLYSQSYYLGGTPYYCSPINGKIKAEYVPNGDPSCTD